MQEIQTNNTNFFERLMHYADLKGFKNPNELASSLGYKSAEKLYRLNRDIGAKPSFEIICDISNLFVNLNLSWLISGRGDIENSVIENAYSYPSKLENNVDQHSNKASSPIAKKDKNGGSENKLSPTSREILSPTLSPTRNLGAPFVITTDNTGRENVVMVPVRARAGYLDGYGDPEFIQTLPTYTLPGLRNGTFRAFELEGHSMNPTLKHHDIVIGSWVESIEDIRDDRVYVIVTKNKGIVIKRVLNRVNEYGFLVCKSDSITNRQDYPNLQIHPDDILELWYSRMYLSSDFKAPSDVWQRINDLEAGFEYLKTKL